MPIYEYECQKCGYQLEIMQKMSDDPIAKCPKCKSTKFEKVFSQTAVQFKGSGWYVTDYSKSGAAAKTKTEKSESKTETKTETATATGTGAGGA